MLQIIEKGLLFLENYISTNKPCSFPNYIDLQIPHNMLNYNSPIAHCYGDLSLAHLFYQASVYLCNNRYQNIAKCLSDKIYDRVPEIIEISNPFFCHGIVGIIYYLHHFEEQCAEYRESDIKKVMLEK